MATINVFVANSKNDSDESVEAAIEKFKLRFSKNTYVFVKGKDDFLANMKRLGSWEAWEKNVVYGFKFGTVEKKYGLIFCINRVIGKATANIVQHALTAGTKIVLLDPETGEFSAVKAVTKREDTDDWKNGWMLQA